MGRGFHACDRAVKSALTKARLAEDGGRITEDASAVGALVPVVVRRPRMAAVARRRRPLFVAGRAAAVRVEGVPDVPASGIAQPPIVLRRLPVTQRAADSQKAEVVVENGFRIPFADQEEQHDL